MATDFPNATAHTQHEDMNKSECNLHFGQIGYESKSSAIDSEEDRSYDYQRDQTECYEKYMEENFRAIEIVDKDDLENEAVEQAICDLMPNLRAVSTEGFCAECRCFFGGLVRGYATNTRCLCSTRCRFKYL